ncbi:MAG: sugar transferase [Humibacillus sp.]|nr:sugar transferase [Humibacillus sp.]
MRESVLLDIGARPVNQPLTQRSRSLRAVQLGIAGGDLAIVIAATVIASFGREQLAFEPSGIGDVAQSVGGYMVSLWMLVLVASGAYARTHLGVGTTEYTKVIFGSGVTAGIIGISSYLTQFNLSRGFFVLLFAIGVPSLLLWRFAARRLVHQAHRRGRLTTRVLLSGGASHVDDVATVLGREAWLGYDIVGALVPDHAHLPVTAGGVAVVGNTTATSAAVLDLKADLVVFTEGAFPSATDFRRIAWDLEGRHVQMAVVPSLSDISSGRMTMRPVGGLPLVHVEEPQSLGASRTSKRLFDIVGASVALLLASPVLLVFALAIKFGDGGPVLFRQTRVGRDGQFFECLKFRSMVVNAESKLASVSHLNANAEGVLFKAQHDPRITKVGHIIRRFSIDEIPQFINVLRGDMSLVGPRPALPAEVRRYNPDVQRRLHVRPGLTGLWQVSGRSDLSWDDTVRLDLYYVDNWSMMQDLSIMMRTARAVVGSSGAY